jgi:hypothetical protein
MEPTEDQVQLLLAARDKARTLLEEIIRHQAELEPGPPALERAQLEAGRLAMRKAIDSAARMLQSIEDALASIHRERNDDEGAGDEGADDERGDA